MKYSIFFLSLLFFTFSYIQVQSQNVQLVKDITDSGSSFSDSGEEIVGHLGDKVLFTVLNDDTQIWDLWVSDGTEAGTFVILSGANTSYRYEQFVSVSATQIVFVIRTTWESKLYITDGTSIGTNELTYVTATEISNLKFSYNNLYYIDSDEIHRVDLALTSDQVVVTGNSTYLVDFYLKDANTILYTDYINGNDQLIIEDLTTSTQTILKDLGDSFAPGSMYFSEVGDKILFFFHTLDTYSLYATDGTVGGTEKLEDFGSMGAQKYIRKVFNGKLYFDAVLPMDHPSFRGYELYVSDGTVSGTYSLYSAANPINNVDDVVDFNGYIYFSASNGNAGSEILRTDGTINGTVSVINDPIYTYGEFYLIKQAGSLYFIAYSSSLDGVWKSDGTEVGSVVYETGDVDIRSLYAADTKIFLTGYASDTGTELYLFTPTLISGTKDREGNSSFTCYPNPFTDALSIRTSGKNEIVSVRLLDITGQFLLALEYKEILQLPSDLKSGIYLLELNTSETTAFIKVVKE